jgi:hypothetical protein
VRAAAVNGSSPAAARLVQAATVPTAIGVPNSSASNPAVRATGRCCPRHRYTAIAAACGPYCTGADTPAGPAAQVRVPQLPQRRAISRCSTTRTVIFGMSNTWRRVTAAGRPPAGRSAPQPVQAPGSWTTTSAGFSTCRRVRPSCPGCPPGLRPDRPRSDFGAGLSSPSLDGGIEELREEATNCRFSSTISASCSASRACSRAIVRSCAATSATSCS